METKKQIGTRITQSRKALGITIKELSARIKTLSAGRISNWEQGTRSPGPLEAKLLADQLKVSASYLLCLTDNTQGDLIENIGTGFRTIPVFGMREAIHARDLLRSPNKLDFEKTMVIDEENRSIKNKTLFAITVEDNSMQPELNPGDRAIIDGDLQPNPGDYVLVYLTSKKQTVLRKYGEADGCLFLLLANSGLWATVNVRQEDEVRVLGVVVEVRWYLG